MPPRPFRIDIWHNILWSAYKGEVFSSLYRLNNKDEFDFRFFQIAETDKNRVSLSGVDLARHRYPFDLLFKGAYGQIPLAQRINAMAVRVWRSDADLFILTGYEKIECWVQLFLIKLKGKKAAVFCDATLHDNKQTVVKGLFKRLFFKSVDALFGYGPRSREYVVHYGAAPEKFHVRCQAAALPFDYSAETAVKERLAKAAKPDAPRYLYVGRLSSEKGLDILLRAFAQVKQKIPSASLIIVGDGAEKDALQALSGHLGLGDSVFFAGSKSGPDLFEEYSRATCFVLPSRSEPWGLVVNEALHYGCPVIVSDRCGCVPDLVIEGKTGFVHSPDDVEDLALKMTRAPSHFVPSQETVRVCIDHMKNYTPDMAAKEIISACRVLLKNL